MELWQKHWQTYFAPQELLSPDGLQQFSNGNLLLQPFAVDMYVEFRRQMARPFYCNKGPDRRRGYRSYRENFLAKGGEFSRHIQGIAFDTKIAGLTSLEMFQAALIFRDSNGNSFGGIGMYDWGVHLDCRPSVGQPATWDFRSK